MRLLWLDDKRNPFENNWLSVSPIEHTDVIWVKKYFEFVNWITENGLPDGICFDHDLSDIHCSKSTYKEKTGMDCAKWLVEYCLDNNLRLPPFKSHSSNTAGRQNIISILENYNKHFDKMSI